MDKNIDSMLDMYLFESNTLLEQLDEILINSEKVKNFNEESINEIFRIMHTIKGSSAMMQFDSVMSVSHKIEDLFFYVRDNGVTEEHQSALFDLMFKSCDFLKSEISHIENNEPLTVNIGNLEEEINTILKIITFTDSCEDISMDSEQEFDNKQFDDEHNLCLNENTDEENQQTFTVKVYFEENCGMENLRAFMLTKNIKDVCPDITYVPSDIENKKNTEEIARNGFLVNFYSNMDLDLGIKIIESFIYTKDYTLIDQEKKSDITDKRSAKNKNKEEKIDQSNPANNHNGNSKQSLINVNLKKLDKLMDMVGEIVITESMISATILADDSQRDAFEKTTRELRKLTNDLQEIVMSVRMVAVSEVFQKMNRIVRDMSKQLCKEVELIMIGENSELDKTIVDSISDPIMHLVRNAMDHGIESKEERIAKGKNERGSITLSAKNEGGEIIIYIQDDGKGLDPKSILKKAKENGLLQKPDNEYSDREIFNFIFLPGFSTNEVVTEFSGRGVGMDVVKNNLEKIGGVVTVESELDKGTKIMFKIPLTLAIISGMQLTVGGSEFTLPINNIRQAFKADNTKITFDMNMREIVMLRNEYYPIVPLHKIFNIDTDITKIEDGILILVEAANRSYCIFADALLGEQQIVVKQLPIYLNSFNLNESGVTGCAILGTGKISLILDVAKLNATA